MKALLRSATNAVAALATLVASSALAAQPNESGAGKICGVLRSFEGETQVFDYTRTHIGDAAFGTKLRCGDWVSVENGKATLEHSDGAALLVGENTFVQILDPQSGENPEHAHIALYRGEFLAQTTKGEVRVLTPNSLARIVKGGVFLLYSTSAEETQIVGMGGEATLANRFFDSSRVKVEFAKVVSFADPVERLLPNEGRFVNAHELGDRLGRLGVNEGVRDSLERAVKAGAKTRMPVTLATTAKPVPAESIHVAAGGEFAAHAGRAPASVGGMTLAKPKPVARRRATASEPNFALTRRSQEESDKRKLLQALATMRPDDGQ